MCSLNGASSSDDEAASGSDMETDAPVEPITYTLEVCMTELAEEAAGKFFFGAAGETAVEVTVASGAAPSRPQLPCSAAFGDARWRSRPNQRNLEY